MRFTPTIPIASRKLAHILLRSSLLLLVIGAVLSVRLIPFSLKVFHDLAEQMSVASSAGKPPDEAKVYATENALIDAKTFGAEDGRLYPLLSSNDSYYWLRAAQRVLDTGDPCDIKVGKECRDTLSLAPVGMVVSYGHSLHVRAIAGIQRIANWLHPGYPLSASAMVLPLVVGLLGCLPAFFLGSALGGPLGGLVAGLVIGLNPLYLARSAYGDNDIWNVVLPLFAAWSIMHALQSSRPYGRVIFAFIATVIIGVHAAIWSGWPFTVAVIGLGLLAASLFQLVQAIAARQPLRGFANAVFATPVLILILFGAMTALTIGVSASLSEFVAIPANPLARFFADSAPVTKVIPHFWANGFAGVAELQPVTREELASLLGNQWLVFAMLGLYCAFLPQRPLDRWDYGAAAWMIVCGFTLSTRASSNHLVTIGALLLPLALALSGRLRTRVEAKDFKFGTCCIVAAWLCIGMTHKLSVPMEGISNAHGIGTVQGHSSSNETQASRITGVIRDDRGIRGAHRPFCAH